MTVPRRLIPWILGILAAATFPQAEAADPPPGPLDVDDAVRIALKQNYAYQATQAGVGIAEGARTTALAGLLPTARGDVSYAEGDQTLTLNNLDYIFVNGVPTAKRDIPLDSKDTGTSYGLSLREDLSLSRWFNYQGSRDDVRASEFGEEAGAQDLAYTVRQQFYLVMRAQDLLVVQEEDLKLARDEERRVQSMFDLGSVARADLLKAQVRVSEAELALIRQQNQVGIERSRLATLLGYRPETPLKISGNLEATPMVLDSTQAAEESMSRPVLRQAQAQLESAGNLHKAAAWSWFPSLFATLSYGSLTGDRTSDEIGQQVLVGQPAAGDTTLVLFPTPVDSDLERDRTDWAVGAQVNLNIFFNQGANKRARWQARQSRSRLMDLQLAVQQELEEAILNYRSSLKAIDAARRGVESAEEDLRLSQERYQQGLGTILDLLEAQVALTRARNNLVNAQTGVKISEAALDKARGAPLP
jgi:outer membrane protein TolC